MSTLGSWRVVVVRWGAGVAVVVTATVVVTVYPAVLPGCGGVERGGGVVVRGVVVAWWW